MLLFSGSNRFLSPHSVPATRANVEQAIRTIQQMGGGGSTELIPALKRVYAEPKAADVSRTVVVVTDGYVTVEREAFELVRRNLSQANVFSFGIGSSVNRHLMEGLARAGMGEPFIITKPDAGRGRGGALSPHDRVAGADQRQGALRGTGRVRRRAGRNCPTCWASGRWWCSANGAARPAARW